MKRRRILTAICIIMMTLPVGLAYSDVTWIHDANEANSYAFSVKQSASEFYYPPATLDSDKANIISTEEFIVSYDESEDDFPPFSTIATREVIAFGGNIPGGIRVFDMAKGPDLDGDGNPVNPADGLKVQACTQIIPESLNENHGIRVQRTVRAWSTRWFKVDQDGSYEINANLNGIIEFDDFFNSNWHHATKTILADVTLETEVIDPVDNQPNVDEIALLEVTMDTPGSTTLSLSPTNSEGEQITYRLKGRVILTSDVSNYDWRTSTALETLNNDFNLGTPDAPIALTATVTKSATDGSTTGNQGVTSGTSSSSGDSGGGGGGGCFIDAASFHEK